MKATKPYIKASYDDKIIFTDEDERETRRDDRQTTALQAWQKSQGLWKQHPVFETMSVQEAIQWLRGEDCDV